MQAAQFPKSVSTHIPARDGGSRYLLNIATKYKPIPRTGPRKAHFPGNGLPEFLTIMH